MRGWLVRDTDVFWSRWYATAPACVPVANLASLPQVAENELYSSALYNAVLHLKITRHPTPAAWSFNTKAELTPKSVCSTLLWCTRGTDIIPAHQRLFPPSAAHSLPPGALTLTPFHPILSLHSS